MDKTEEFRLSLERELAALEVDRQAFVADFGEAEYEGMVDSWRAKLARVGAGELRWGLFRARRPSPGRDFHVADD